MIRIAICDDNPEILKMLEVSLLDRYQDSIRIRTFLTTFSLLTYLQDEVKGDADLLLMDIEVGKDNGIETAGNLQKQFPNLKVIFITGFIDYARYIFRADPADFLVKPVDKERLYEAVDRAVSKLALENDKVISIHFKGELLKISTDQILYLETVQKVTYIHTMEKEFATRKKLDVMLAELPHNFIRCHQSFIINMDKIIYFTAGQAELCNGQKIPISRNRYKAAREAFMKYLGDEI